MPAALIERRVGECTETAPRYVRCAPGQHMAQPQPGDVILVRGTGFLGRGIRLWEWLCCRGEERAYAHWSHAALIVSSSGVLVEVVATGVALGRLERYRNDEYHYVRLNLSGDERERAADFARSCLRQKYDRLSFVLLALAKLLRGRLRVPDRGQQGCVALIVRALQRAGIPFEGRPTEMSVTDLARYFNVRP